VLLSWPIVWLLLFCQQGLVRASIKLHAPRLTRAALWGSTWNRLLPTWQRATFVAATSVVRFSIRQQNVTTNRPSFTRQTPNQEQHKDCSHWKTKLRVNAQFLGGDVGLPSQVVPSASTAWLPPEGVLPRLLFTQEDGMLAKQIRKI
jgi:hypothetical protein